MIHLRVRMIRGGLAAALMLTSISGCGDDGSGLEADTLNAETDTAQDETDTTGEDTTDGSDTSETESTDTESTETTDTTDSTDTTDTEGALSFAADVYPIFMAECSCHIANVPGMLPMPNATTAYANLVDVASIQVSLDRVTPGDPESSHLYKKITDTQTFGAPMPSMGPLLGPDEVMIVEAWILGGALE